MQRIIKNTLVTLTLKIEGEDGTFLDESDELMYLHGSYGQIFPSIEELLENKTVGDSFNVLLTPAQAFGEYDENLLLKEPLSELPEDIAVGMELDGKDESVVWIVEEILEGFAVLNANHELAGVPLRVSGEVLVIEQLTEEGAQKILDMDHEH